MVNFLTVVIGALATSHNLKLALINRSIKVSQSLGYEPVEVSTSLRMTNNEGKKVKVSLLSKTTDFKIMWHYMELHIPIANNNNNHHHHN